MALQAKLEPPKQARSRDTLNRIVVAARELLRERDFDDVSVDDIVRRAESSKGSFYHRFGDKEALLTHLLDLEHEAAVADWSAYLDPGQWRGCTIGEVLDGFLDRLMEIYRGHTSLMRAYAGEILSKRTHTRMLSVQLNRHVLACLQRLVEERKDQVGHPDPDVATAFLLTTLITVLPPLILFPTPDLLPAPMTLDELERELRTMMRAYVEAHPRGDGPHKTDPERV